MIREKLKKAVSKVLVGAMLIGTLACVDSNTLNANAAGTRGDVIWTAQQEVGYHEKASNSQLDDFYANSGSGNYTKYARDIGVGNGAAWCAYFTWWVMMRAGVNDFPRSGWVPTIESWFSQRGLYRARGTYIPNPGDYIIFGSSSHVGLVEGVANGCVTTIEGNSSDQVSRHTYSLANTYIKGYGIMNLVDDCTPPAVTDFKVYGQSTKGFWVSCKVTDESPISFVTFPTWTEKNGQDDIDKQWMDGNGYSFGQINGNTATFYVDLSKHNNEMGTYIIHIYAQDVYGNRTNAKLISQVQVEFNAPTISNVMVENLSEDGYDLTFNVEDKESGVQFVACPTYTTSGGKDDLPENWADNSIYKVEVNNGNCRYHVSVADHDGYRGSYTTEIVVYDNYNNYSKYLVQDIVVPTYEEITNADDAAATDVDNEETNIEDTSSEDVNNEDINNEDINNEDTTIEDTTDTTVGAGMDNCLGDETVSTPVEVIQIDTENEEPPIEDVVVEVEVEDLTIDEMINDVDVIITDEYLNIDNSIYVDNSTYEDNSIYQDNSVCEEIIDESINVNIDNSTYEDNSVYEDNSTYVDNTTVDQSTVNNVTNNNTVHNNTTNNITNYQNPVQSEVIASKYADLKQASNIYTAYKNLEPENDNNEQIEGALKNLINEILNMYISNYIPEGFELEDVTEEIANAEDFAEELISDTVAATDDKEDNELVQYYTILNGELVKVTISFK